MIPIENLQVHELKSLNGSLPSRKIHGLLFSSQNLRLLSTLEERITPRLLRIYAEILRGKEPKKLRLKLVEIGSFLHQPYISRSKEATNSSQI